MKQCKNCKWVINANADRNHCSPPNMLARQCYNDSDRPAYTRKWWKFWAPKVLLLALALLLGVMEVKP